MNQGRWRGIYTPPKILAVRAARGQNFRWAGYLRGESPPKTSGTPPERKLQNDLAKIPPENFQGRNFRDTGNFRGELTGRSTGTPTERDPKNDLAVFSLGRKNQGKTVPELTVHRPELPGAGISGLRTGTSDRKSTRLNSSHRSLSRMPSSA